MNTRIAVKENFDEEDLSDDVDDEVFVRDGKKSILKMDKQKGDERPLMPPRRKSKQKQSSNPEVCSRQPCNIYNCLLPVYFGIATIISIAFLMLLYIFLVDKLPLLMNKFDLWSSDTRQEIITEPCLNVKLNNIWTQTIPKLVSHTQIKLLDVNKDNVEDIIIGIGTELDEIHEGNRLCREFFNSAEPRCSGGVVALDGKTGSIIWHRWLRRLVLSVQCDFEITNDFVSDCIVTGKGGLLVAISGVDGAIIWEGEAPREEAHINLYNVLIIRDLNADNHMDLIATHTTDGSNGLESHLYVISGENGNELQKIAVTPNEPILHPPQILTDIDGGETVLFITGSPNHSGGIYMIPIFDLLKGDISRIKNLFHYKTGILAPPILVDMNLDGLHDIAYVADSNVYVIDGATYTKIWNTSLYDYVSSAFQITSVSSVTPAYFNNDWIPDLLVSFAVGSDYPEYYFSMALVLNGKNGSLLLNDPIIRSSVSDTVGAISLSNAGPGHDTFLFWTAACQGRENGKEPFSFMPNENRAFWSDLCGLRFNSTLVMELYALSRYMDPPGTLLYSAKSHTVDAIDSQNENLIDNLIERSQQIPNFYGMINPMEVMQPVDAEIVGRPIEGKPYGPENNGQWGFQKVKYQNYDTNENSNDGLPLSDYEQEKDEPMIGRNEKDYGRPRYARSIQRPQSAISTMLPKVSASGIIAKSFDGNNLDLILAHFEVKSDENVQLVVGKNEECIQNSLALSSIPSSKYHGLPRSRLKEQVFRDCMVYISPQNYNTNNPNNKILSMQMENIYITRNRITCSCKYANNENDKTCDSILPYEKQSYPAYLGKHGNSAYKTRVPFD